MTLFERGANPSKTHTSQIAHSIELNASDSATKASFRNFDDATGTHTKFLLVDTPGHGKLCNVSMGKLACMDKVKAVVFVVDAAALGEQETLAPTAAYLYDMLLFLQKRATSKGKDKAAIPVLIAANKMDLFTALPATMVKSHLEMETVVSVSMDFDTPVLWNASGLPFGVFLREAAAIHFAAFRPASVRQGRKRQGQHLAVDHTLSIHSRRGLSALYCSVAQDETTRKRARMILSITCSNSWIIRRLFSLAALNSCMISPNRSANQPTASCSTK
ncbi:signal recognition particle receptor beta subunit domain-containing protein [Trichoderma sp. SZMC 28014]